jgi:catechol 2,3-dioxygenase-like lactoylglutathione lyase family enzyme
MMTDTVPQPSRPWPCALAAITLFVDDLDASKDFYRRTFGLDVVFEDAASAVFRFGETLNNLLDVDAAPELIEPDVAPAGVGHRAVLTLHVDDIDVLASTLAACPGWQRPCGRRAPNDAIERRHRLPPSHARTTYLPSVNDPAVWDGRVTRPDFADGAPVS